MDIYQKYPDLMNEDFVASFDYGKCYTVLHPDQAFSELDVAVALISSQGILSAVARLLKRPRRHVEGFIARNTVLCDLAVDLENEFLDAVEHGHRVAALAGDLQTQRFFLTTKGKDRGFVTRSENTGKNGDPFQIDMNVQEADAFTKTIMDMANRVVTETPPEPDGKPEKFIEAAEKAREET